MASGTLPSVQFPRSRRLRLLTLVLVAATIAACGAGQAPTEAQLRRGTVERGDIEVTVSTTGTILPEEQVNMTFGQPGVVDEVLVEVGEDVQAGDVLARLDAGQLETAVRQAELALETQRLNYERLFEPPSNAELAAAQAGVEAARANYSQIAAGADPEQVWIGELQYQQAYKQYEQAEITLKAMQPWLPEDQVVTYREQRDQALLGVEMARLQLNQLQAGPGSGALQAAQASITQAQAEVDRLLAEPSELEIARLETQVSQAELALNRAREGLGGVELRAPFAGAVAQVNVRTGAVVPGQGPAIVIVNRSRLHVDVSIDEIDVAHVMPGQPAVVSLDAAPNQTVQGQVTEVSPAATVEGGIVTYEARIDLEPTDVPLLVGMTATAEIITQRLEDVLLVPNWAIRLDRSTGETVVSVLTEEGALREVPVALGVRGDTESQVISGLEEGETVAVSLAPEQLDLLGGGS